MSAPSTRAPLKIPVSQINHERVEVVRNLQTTEARELKLFAEGLSQKGGVNLYPAVRVGRATVFDEAKHSELIHKKVYARPCSADHRRQDPL